MKLLRNPFVTGALAVLAVGVVCYQVLKNSRFFRFRATSKVPTVEVARSTPVPQSGTAAAPAAPSPRVTAPPARTIPKPEGPIDIASIASRFPMWVDAPDRDPFLAIDLSAPRQPGSGQEGPSPVASWKLKGIWRQTGSRLAAINDDVYGEGDEIQGYRLERIDADQVWFRGTNRLERLGFNTLPQVTPLEPVQPLKSQKLGRPPNGPDRAQPQL